EAARDERMARRDGGQDTRHDHHHYERRQVRADHVDGADPCRLMPRPLSMCSCRLIAPEHERRRQSEEDGVPRNERDKGHAEGPTTCQAAEQEILAESRARSDGPRPASEQYRANRRSLHLAPETECEDGEAAH